MLNPGRSDIDTQAEHQPLKQRRHHLIQTEEEDEDDRRDHEVDQDRAQPTLTRQRNQRDDGQNAGKRGARHAKRVRFRLADQPFAHAPHGFFQRPNPHGDQQARQADRQERRLPGLQTQRSGGDIGVPLVPGLHHRAAEEQTDASADVDAAGVDGEHRRPQSRGEVVRQHGERSRRCARLAHPDAEAAGGQCKVVFGEAR